MEILCSVPKVSSLSFMRYLFASLAKERNVIIDKTGIVETIYNFRAQIEPESLYVFDDIEFRTGIDSIVSYDINAGINNLQTLGIVGKLNPSYEKLVIYLTEKDADTILESCDPDVRSIFLKLASSFEKRTKK